VQQSSFFFSQALTVLHWSRLSDTIGRKPVLLASLFGITLSMLLFGLSSSYPSLVLSRSLQGALNGNVGVMKSMMADVTDSTNVAAAFSFLPIAWVTGGTVGLLLSAMLAHPYERFSGTIFSKLEFFKHYPYFLAYSVPALYAIVALVVTRIYLKEVSRFIVFFLPISHIYRQSTPTSTSASSAVHLHHPPNLSNPHPLRHHLSLKSSPLHVCSSQPHHTAFSPFSISPSAL
jgi:MFS family permease